MLAASRIDLLLNGLEGLRAQEFHLGQNIRVEIDTRSTLRNHFLKVTEREHIAILVTAVFGTILLNRIIGKMNEVIIEILGIHGVGLTRSP